MLTPFSDKYAYWKWLGEVASGLPIDQERMSNMAAKAEAEYGIKVLFDGQFIRPEFEIVDEEKWLVLCLTR